MSETDPIVIAVGGTGASAKGVAEYYSHLVKRSANDVPVDEKFFALLNGGKGKLQDTYDDLEERVSLFRRAHIGRKIVALGHSQGGVHAARLGVDGWVSAVVSMAGPLKGGVTQGMPTLDGNYEAARLLEREFDARSPFMSALHEDMAHKWPHDTPLHIVAATYDAVVPRESQFGVELPEGTDVHNYIVVPSWIASSGLMRNAMLGRLDPGVQMIHSDLPVDHFTLPHATGMPSFITKVVRDVELKQR